VHWWKQKNKELRKIDFKVIVKADGEIAYWKHEV